MIYYPVLIPTLNRANHLKRCLESLARNTGAQNTEIYISVDFPPHEKYKSGYEQVKDLLSYMDFSVFQKVHIFFQETNLGPSGNSVFLRSQIEEKYDAYIFSEDDNEFAPNFLEYINKGLEFFKDDSRVLAVCGSRDTNWITNGKNAIFTKLFAAYGVGIWIDKRNREVALGNTIVVPPKPYSPKKMYELYKKNSYLFCAYIIFILSTDTGLFWKDEKNLNWCDTVHSIYMHFTDSVCIAPAISKSRTWGNDGSGVNMQKIDIDTEKEIPLDQDLYFEYNNFEGLEFIDENYKIGNLYLSHSWKLKFTAVCFYIILLIFGKKRKGAVKFIKKLQKIIKKIKTLKK